VEREFVIRGFAMEEFKKSFNIGS